MNLLKSEFCNPIYYLEFKYPIFRFNGHRPTTRSDLQPPRLTRSLYFSGFKLYYVDSVCSTWRLYFSGFKLKSVASLCPSNCLKRLVLLDKPQDLLLFHKICPLNILCSLPFILRTNFEWAAKNLGAYLETIEGGMFLGVNYAFHIYLFSS